MRELRSDHADETGAVCVYKGIQAVARWRGDFLVLTAAAARQFLMPAINRATGMGHKMRFVWLHGFSAVLTLAHIVLAGMVLVQIAR